ncbi:MAG: aspartate--tRNA(Asn) ligase, partial [Thermoplasmata archaeon]
MLDDMGTWRRTHYTADIRSEEQGREVILAGWIHDMRVVGGISFIILRDREGMVQITVKKKDVGDDKYKRLITLPRESVIMVKGFVNFSPKVHAGLEIIISEYKVLSIAKKPLPLGIADDVHADLDTRLNARFLDVRKPEVMALFKIRATMLSSIRKTLESMGFIEVHTPKIVATATEGGTALFPVKYFEMDAFLNQSPQLYKQILMATGMDRVYEIGPAFRAEEHDTTKHLNEFTSVDIEMAFSDHNDAMNVLERVIKDAVRAVNNEMAEELEVLGVGLPDIEYNFPRVSYDECVDFVNSHGANVRWGEDFDAEAMKILGKEYDCFYFIVD